MISKSSLTQDCICLNDVNNTNVYLNMLRVINYILRTSMKSLFELCQLSQIVIYIHMSPEVLPRSYHLFREQLYSRAM